MIAFGDWLKQLVMIVLLAVFSDLLLPTKAMQKYVRVVLGLTIIAAMMQPIVPFFKKNWADEMTNAAIAEFDAGQVGSGQGERSTQNAYAQALSDQTSATTNGLVASQLATQIERTFNITPKSITVSGAESGSGTIAVTVVIALLDAPKTSQIQGFIEQSLNVSLKQITVTAGGG